ncbi:MAG TPA: hypothetical protein VF796_05380, partial [Humisphaera sp.]
PASRPAAAEPTFPIQLSRPSKVGDRLTYEAIGAQRTKLTIRQAEGPPQERETAFGIRLSGTLRILETTGNGRETKVELAVRECVVSVDKESRPLLPRGAVLVATRGKDGTDFEVRGGPAVPPEMAEALSVVLEVPDPAGTDDDVIFGSKDRHRIGDVWPLDAAAAVKELDRVGMAAKDEDVFGETAVLERVKTAGLDCLRLGIKFRARKLKSAKPNPDATMRVVEGSYSVVGKVDYPLDKGQPAAKEETKVDSTTELDGTDADGKRVRVTRVVEKATQRNVARAAI